MFRTVDPYWEWRVLSYLEATGPIIDHEGRAAVWVREGVGYTRTHNAFADIMRRLEKKGRVRREVHGRRTYLIELRGSAR